MYTKGYSLVEVLVAISILMLSIVGPMTIAAKSMQSAQYARQQNTAFFLAQEGITAANVLRNDGSLDAYLDSDTGSWAWINETSLQPCFTSTGCDIDFRDDSLLDNVVNCGTASCELQFNEASNRAVYQHVSGDATPYTRVLVFDFITEDEVVVDSTVTWGTTLLGGTQSVTLSTSLFNLYK